MAQGKRHGLPQSESISQRMGVHPWSDASWAAGEEAARSAEVLPVSDPSAPCLIGMEASGGAHYWARDLHNSPHGELMSHSL